jgi:hypothetical protein
MLTLHKLYTVSPQCMRVFLKNLPVNLHLQTWLAFCLLWGRNWTTWILCFFFSFNQSNVSTVTGIISLGVIVWSLRFCGILTQVCCMSVPSLRVQQSCADWNLSSKKSVRNYQHTLRNISEEWCPQLHRCESLKWPVLWHFIISEAS